MRKRRWMGFMVGILALAAGAAAQPPDAVRFRYAFVAYSPSASEAALTPITRDATLHSGDYFKFYLEKDAPCHVYLVYFSAQGDVHLLFPAGSDEPPPVDETAVAHYVPAGKQWFRFDTTVGEERFYLLASTARLTGLEDLFRDLSAADNVADRDLLRIRVKGEVRRLRWENRNFQRAAERPVAIMGQPGDAPGAEMPPQRLSDLATVVSGQEFYSRAFTIDHR